MSCSREELPQVSADGSRSRGLVRFLFSLAEVGTL